LWEGIYVFCLFDGARSLEPWNDGNTLLEKRFFLDSIEN
jgi:hypothetical protein